MIAVIVDNNAETLNEMFNAICTAFPDADIHSFQDELSAAQYTFNNPVNLMLTRADNRRMSGFDMIRFVRKLKTVPDVALVSDSQELRNDAMRAGAFGFLLRPVTATQISDLLTEESMK